MGESHQSTKCFSCNSDVPEERIPCPNCGETKRITYLSMSEKITAKASMRIIGVEAGKSIRNFFVSFVTGWSPSVRKDLSPEGAYVEQRVDRRGNSYTKKVIDAKTSRVIKYLKEKLTSHK